MHIKSLPKHALVGPIQKVFVLTLLLLQDFTLLHSLSFAALKNFIEKAF